MNRHSYQLGMRRGIGCFACSILGGLLLAFQLVLPSTTFALSEQPVSTADPPVSQSLAQSEVSVVRLVYSYNATPTTTAGNPVLCTSLGILVKSFPASTSSNSNTWVLTDGSLLNTTPAPCAPTGSSSRGKASTYTLSTISVYANNVYTSNTSTHALLGTYTAAPANVFLCFATPCSNGAFLFAFHTDQIQPTLDVATAETIQQFGIALTSVSSPTAHPLIPLPTTAAALAFLNPTAVTRGAISNQNEVGMPFINKSGQLVSMQLQNNVLLTSSDYNAFVSQHSSFNNAPANPLQVAWQNGIGDYYGQNYQEAIKDFQLVESLNPNFVAAKTYELSATALSHSQSSPSGGNSVPGTQNANFLGIPKSTFLIIGIVTGFLLLIAFLIILSVWSRRRHELALFESKQAEAQRNAEREILQQQIAQQQNSSVEMTKHESILRDNASSEQQVSTINDPISINQLCPNCGQAAPAGATYCPNCRYPLSPVAGEAPSALEFPVTEKALPSTVTTSQPHLTPVKEIAMDDLAIQEALKRLWDRAER